MLNENIYIPSLPNIHQILSLSFHKIILQFFFYNLFQMAARVLQQPMQAAFADTSGGSGSESDIETIEDTINKIDNYLNKSPKIVRKKAKLINPYKLRYIDILVAFP